MLNVEHLLKVYKEMAYNDGNVSENFNLFDYFQRIWEDVNTSCAGHHNFILQVEGGKTDRVRIIDLQVHNPEIKPKDLFEFKIQSNKSIVRDFNFNTTIPSALSATIAIAAQAPSSVSDLDQVTFANFSKGIKSRFTKDSLPQLIKQKKKLKKKTQKAANKKKDYDKDLKKYRETIANLSLYNLKIQQGDYDFSFWGGGREIDGKSFGDIVSLANSVTSKTISLLSRLPNGQKRKTIPSNKSAIIPLKFNCKMDGVSGIVIGHVFKVEKDKLPKGYQSDDVAFIVMSEKQNITTGQDWTTEISGQLMLLDLESEENKEDSGGGLGEGGIGDNVNEGISPEETNEVELINNEAPLPTDEVLPPVEEVAEPSIPLVGNTGLTREEINNGGLVSSTRRVNKHTAYEYAYIIHSATAKAGNPRQELQWRGENDKANIIGKKVTDLENEYYSVFQIPYLADDFQTPNDPQNPLGLANGNMPSAVNTYEGWISLYNNFFPEKA
jgi:hypothetical protein